MILNLDKNLIRCPHCGNVWHKIEKRYCINQDTQKSTKYEEVYNVTEEKTVLVCFECGAVIKEIPANKTVKINIPSN